MKKGLTFGLLFLSLIVPVFAHADVSSDPAATSTVMLDTVNIYKAKVLAITTDEMSTVEDTTVQSEYQVMQVEFLQGPQTGKTVEVQNDYIKLNKGDVFYVLDTIRADTGQEVYSVWEPDRMPTIILFGLIFIGIVLLVGGMQGLRGLLSLLGSFILILFVLIPGILHGFSPVLVSIFVSSIIIIFGSYITHGFNKTTSSAVIGMIITVIFTGVLAFLAVHMGKLTGFSSDESVFLNLNNSGKINIQGVLLGGIMIGVLGVLYDVAIGQAISVEELHHIAPHISRGKIYRRALRIGREHIGALVNTLAIAYVGVSLPLLLLYSQAPNSPLITINREVFTTEIIRILVGSIGLVLAVPITTFLAVLILVKVKKVSDHTTIIQENEAVKHFEHHH